MKGFFQRLFSLLLVMFCWFNSAEAEGYSPGDTVLVDKLLSRSARLLKLNPVEGLATIDSAYSMAVDMDYFRGKVNALVRQVQLFLAVGKNDSVLPTLGRAMELVKSKGIQKGIAAIHNQYGSYYRRVGQYVKSLAHYQEGYRVYKAINHCEGMAVGNQNLAIVYKIQGDTLASIARYKRALQIHREVGNVNGMVSIYLNLSFMLQDLGKLDSALYYQNVALELAGSYHLQRGEALAYSARGGLYNRLNRVEEALSDLRQAERFFRQSGELYRLGIVQMEFGKAYSKQRRFARSAKKFASALELARKAGSKEIEKAVLFYQTSLYERQGDFHAALKSFRSMIDMQGELTNAQVRRAMDSLRRREVMVQKDQELKALAMQLDREKLERQRNALEVEKQELELSRGRLRTWLLIGLLVFLAVLAGFIFVKYRDNRRHQGLLEEKQVLTESALEEKEVLLGEIHHRVKNNLQLIYNLLDMQRRTLEDENSARALRDSMDRISSMALVHQKLYGDEKAGGVRADEYLSQLVERLVASYDLDPDRILVHQRVAPLVLDTDTVIPVGIIVNELLTNAAKYAFPDGKAGTIWLRLEPEGEQLCLEVKDDGVGNPGESAQAGKGFGLRIVKSLGRQLKADVRFNSNPGFQVRLLINKFRVLKPLADSPHSHLT